MSSRRTIILIAAVLVGAIAAYSLYTYVNGLEDKANGHAQRVTIYKITRDIPKGFFGDEAFTQGYIKKDQIAKEFRPATAITDPKQIDGLVAISNLPANSVVVSDQFVTQQSSLSTFSQLLKNNQVAITITVDQVHGVAGLLVPGDFVNILITGGAAAAPPPGASATAATSSASLLNGAGAVYLYQKVQILAIGQTKKLEPGESAPVAAGAQPAGGSGLITFAVPAVAAQYIASVSGERMYLTLVAKDYQPVPLVPLNPATPIPGLDPSALTPYGPNGQTE